MSSTNYLYNYFYLLCYNETYKRYSFIIKLPNRYIIIIIIIINHKHISNVIITHMYYIDVYDITYSNTLSIFNVLATICMRNTDLCSSLNVFILADI